MPAQEPVLSFPSPASLDALAEHFYDGSEHRAPTAAVSCAPSLLNSGDAAAGVSPVSPSIRPPALAPHAEPPLVIDHDDEGIAAESERSKSF